jgi:hypothetical protein
VRGRENAEPVFFFAFFGAPLFFGRDTGGILPATGSSGEPSGESATWVSA